MMAAAKGYKWRDINCEDFRTARPLCEKSAVCPDGFTQAGKGCYKLGTETMTKPEAQAWCDTVSNHGAYLATVSDSEEQKILRGLAKQEGGDFWIGLSDAIEDDMDNLKKDTFLWDNGERANYRVWINKKAVKEPARTVEESEHQDCVRMVSDHDYEWADVECESDATKSKPLCETGHAGVFARKYRLDGRCGERFLNMDGEPGQCNPNHRAGNVCCSKAGWCGMMAAHCDCDECVDYSDCTRANEGSFRLVGASLDADAVARGRVEVCQKGKWSTICDGKENSAYKFTLDDADIICQNLGRSVATRVWAESALDGKPKSHVVQKAFGPGRADQPICKFKAGVLSACNSKNTDCTHQEDVSVQCK